MDWLKFHEASWWIEIFNNYALMIDSCLCRQRSTIDFIRYARGFVAMCFVCFLLFCFLFVFCIGNSFFISHDAFNHFLGLYSLSGKTSYRQILWNLEAARLCIQFKFWQKLKTNSCHDAAAFLVPCGIWVRHYDNLHCQWRQRWRYISIFSEGRRNRKWHEK